MQKFLRWESSEGLFHGVLWNRFKQTVSQDNSLKKSIALFVNTIQLSR